MIRNTLSRVSKHRVIQTNKTVEGNNWQEVAFDYLIHLGGGLKGASFMEGRGK